MRHPLWCINCDQPVKRGGRYCSPLCRYVYEISDMFNLTKEDQSLLKDAITTIILNRVKINKGY